MNNTNARRQRADGTWTFTTPEWDNQWYWPVGTRVRVGADTGTVVKQNAVTVRVRFDGDANRTGPVSMTALTRLDAINVAA